MICKKCQIRYIVKPFSDYSESICWICWLKVHKKYKAAAKELGYSVHGKQTSWEYRNALGKPQNGFFNWSTNLLEEKIGWSFWVQAYWTLIFANILNHPGLNKTGKVPELTNGLRKDGWPKQLSDYDILIKLGWSEWRIKVALGYTKQ